MKTIVLASVLASVCTTLVLAQSEPLQVPLAAPQRVFVCNTQAALLDVLNGIMQAPGTFVDRRDNYMLTRPDGTKDCDYFRDANGNVLLFATLENFTLVEEENMFFGTEQVNVGLYHGRHAGGGEVYLSLLLALPVDGSYTKAVEPIGLMPDTP